MFETNSASCAGFPGISDSFGAALWALDWAFTMATNNFTTALFHTGGIHSYYNPFTAPPTNQSTFRQWTVGPVYYSALVAAEAFGPSNASQIADITSNVNTPIYVIYENGAPTKVALFNFVSDTTGASTYTATISIGGGTTGQSNATPSQVQVKYVFLSTDSHRLLSNAQSQIPLGRFCCSQGKFHLGGPSTSSAPSFFGDVRLMDSRRLAITLNLTDDFTAP